MSDAEANEKSKKQESMHSQSRDFTLGFFFFFFNFTLEKCFYHRSDLNAMNASQLLNPTHKWVFICVNSYFLLTKNHYARVR